MPTRPSAPTPADLLRRAGQIVERQGRVALAHIVRVEGSTAGKTGWKLLVAPDGTTEGNLGGGSFEALVIADARARLADRLTDGPQAATDDPAPDGSSGQIKRYYMTEKAAKGQPTGMVCGGFAEVYLEVIEAPPVAVVYGGGPVGQALARGAELAGFDLVVLDDRPDFRRPELFPEGTRLPAVGRDFALQEAGPDGGDPLAAVAGRPLYAVIVTRCWETDVAALATLLATPPERLTYLGLMGSRRKVEHVKEELAARGHRLDDPSPPRTHRPRPGRRQPRRDRHRRPRPDDPGPLRPGVGEVQVRGRFEDADTADLPAEVRTERPPIARDEEPAAGGDRRLEDRPVGLRNPGQLAEVRIEGRIGDDLQGDDEGLQALSVCLVDAVAPRLL